MIAVQIIFLYFAALYAFLGGGSSVIPSCARRYGRLRSYISQYVNLRACFGFGGVVNHVL